MAEKEAKKRGCKNAHLDTHVFKRWIFIRKMDMKFVVSLMIYRKDIIDIY
jgi:hypothetical protein